jgi:hypothetical protein
MSQLIAALLNDRLVRVLDGFLVCLGLTMTVAAVAPLLQSAAAAMRRRPLAERRGGCR